MILYKYRCKSCRKVLMLVPDTAKKIKDEFVLYCAECDPGPVRNDCEVVDRIKGLFSGFNEDPPAGTRPNFPKN